MSRQVQAQVRHHFRAIDEAQASVDWDAVEALLAREGEITLAPVRRRTLYPGPAIALAVAIVAFVGLLFWWSGMPDSEVADSTPPPTQPTSVPTTSVLESEQPLDNVIAEGPPLARVSSGIVVLEDVVVTADAFESLYTPIGDGWEGHWSPQSRGGGIVDVGDLLVAMGSHVADGSVALIASGDGIGWTVMDTTGLDDVSGTPRLFSAGDRYWIQSEDGQTVRLWTSSDLITWEQVVALDGVSSLFADGWLEFGGNLVGFTHGSGHVLDLETASSVRSFDPPWGDSWVLSAYVDRSGLQVVVGDDSGGFATNDQYTTTDLVDWESASPTVLGDGVLLFDAVTGQELSVTSLQVRGSLSTGLSAQVFFDAVDQLGGVITVTYFSTDGETWGIAGDPNPLPEAPVFDDILLARLPSGSPVLISQRENLGAGNTLLLSVDGIDWQEVQLDVEPSPGIDELPGAGVQESIAVVGDRVFLYKNTQGWLNAWVVDLSG